MNFTPKSLAFRLSLPVFVAYFPFGFLLSIFWAHVGLPAFYAPIYCAAVYAGSYILIAMNLMLHHGGYWPLILAGTLISLRNSFYGLAMLKRFEGISKIKKIVLIFLLVDANYAILSIKPPLKDRANDIAFCLWFSIFCYAYWVCGALLGFLLVNYISISIVNLEFVILSFFALMAYETYLKSKNLYPFLIAAIIGTICLLSFADNGLVISLALTALALLLTPARNT